MSRTIARIAIACCVANLVSIKSYGQSPGPNLPVLHALQAVDDWLGKSSAHEGWQRYLRLNDLRSQVELGPAADLNQVVEVLQRLESGAPGLDRPAFVRLRQAVAQWRTTLPTPQLAQLPGFAQQAKAQFEPADQEALAADRANVVRAAAALNRFLGRGASGAGWRAYLNLDQLDAQFKPGVDPSLKTVGETLTQLRTDHVGLDLPQFTALATSLTRYAATLEQNRNPNARAEFEATLDRLSERLKSYIAKPTDEDLKQIGIDLDWLVARRQALTLVDSFTRVLSQPNLYMVVNEDFLAAGLNRPVDETQPLRDNILGTSLHGTGRTTGIVTFQLLPDPDQGVLLATMHGVNRSNNTGYNRSAIINSVGTTQLSATKRITIDADGLHGMPVAAEADTSTRITGIGSSKRGVVGCIVTKVASKRVGQQKGAAETIAGQHAEARLAKRFEEQIGQQLARSNARLDEQFRDPLVRRGQLPHIYFTSARDQLFATVLQASGAQLGAQLPPPDPFQDAQVSLRLHESMVNNFTAGTLAGETVGQPELEEFALKLFGKVPERFKPDPGKEPWTITFADEDPITFTVVEGGFVLTGRGKRYTSGDRTFQEMNFTVRYKLERQGHGVKGTRIGEIEILPPGFVPGGGRTLPLRLSTLRTLMSRRLNKIFEPEIVKDEPAELQGEFKAAGPLEMTDLVTSGGWLGLGWRQLGHGANTAAAGSAN